MTNLSKKLMLVLIPVLVLLIACLGLLVLLPGANSGNVYVEQITAARRLSENGDYQNAIIYYRNAIEEDATQEEPYLELAKIYFYLNMREEGLSVLRDGIARTSSLKLIELLKNYEGQIENSTENFEKLNTLGTVNFNSTYANIFSTYNFEKYSNDYTVKNEQKAYDLYTVIYEQYEAIFEYANSSNNVILDTSTGRPYAYARPTSIKLNKLSQFITGVESGVSVDQLKNCGASNIAVKVSNTSLAEYLVTFEYNGMKIILGCDENGIVTGDDAYNEITPKAGQVVIEKVISTGNVIDVTTGVKVTNITLKFREGKNNKNGEIVAEKTSVNGEYSVELDPGDYTVEVIADGYNTEFFDIYISDNESNIENTLSISPILSSNEIRFVLEWGATPRDLDSHLDGQCNTGNGYSISVDFRNKIAKYGDKTIAELDLDDTDGFGPETVTLYDTNGTYEYKIHRFSSDGDLALSGATVKIYTSNSSNPIIVTVPDDVDSEWWTVCTVKDGEIKNINGRQS